MLSTCFEFGEDVSLLGAQVVEWLRAHATYAADPGSNSGWTTLCCMSSPPLPPISCLSTVKIKVPMPEKIFKKKRCFLFVHLVYAL